MGDELSILHYYHYITNVSTMFPRSFITVVAPIEVYIPARPQAGDSGS